MQKQTQTQKLIEKEFFQLSASELKNHFAKQKQNKDEENKLLFLFILSATLFITSFGLFFTLLF